MKIILVKLVAAFVLIIASIGCTAVPALPPTSAPPTQALQTSAPAELTIAPMPDTWTDNFNRTLAPGWSWVNEDSTRWNLTDAPGALRIITQGESLYAVDKPKNLLLRDAPASDFEVTTKVTFDPQNDFQQAAILIYQDHDNFVLLNRGFCGVQGCLGSGIFLDSEVQGKMDFENHPGPRTATSLETTWLKLRKEETQYIGFYSDDGQNWNELGWVENPMTPTKVGLTANNSNEDPSVPQIPADYDFFTLTGESNAVFQSQPEGTEQDLATVSPIALTSDQLVAEISVGTAPHRLADGADAVWVANSGANTVSRIDPKTNQVVATIDVGALPGSVALSEGAVWVANNQDGTISRIDPTTNEVVATINVGAAPRNVAVSEGSIWVTLGRDDAVARIDPMTNQVVATVQGIESPAQIAAGEGTLWVTSRDGNLVSRIDPKTNQVVATIEIGFPTIGLAVTKDAVWVAGNGDTWLKRIDPATNQVVAQIKIADDSWGVAVGEDAVWLTTNSNNTLSKIDPQTNQIVAVFEVGSEPLGIAVVENALWVVNNGEDTVWRIKP